MSDNNKHNGGRRDCGLERWARAFGVSTERLAALIKEVLEEQQALGNERGPSREDHRHRLWGGWRE